MATHASIKTDFEKWQDGISKAVGNSHWDTYDNELKTAVSEFNQHLKSTPGYRQLDWLLIKAMLWTESGASSSEWRTKPMQIGVAGDAGLASFLSGREGGELILPPKWQRRLTTGTVRSMPAHNIRAGIGYLLMRMANFEFQSVLVADATGMLEVTIKPGDSLAKIAKAHGSTPEIMKKLNPTSTVLRPGHILKFQKGSVQRVITGWRQITTDQVARRYNGGGDPRYAQKLDYALGLLRK
ncbi:MAG TPA: LysM domain-containing protein [Duganella sp.]|nr:LysM domain-containing protein [Duganella sp.]